jgi:hypothetical protein
MRDRPGAWLQDAVLKMGPILLGAPLLPSQCCMRDLGLGLSPTGYKLMRRASHRFNKGLRLGSNTKCNSTAGETRVLALTYLCVARSERPRGIHCTMIIARRALSPSTPRAYGATLRASGVGFASGVHATLLGSCLAACACAPGRSEGAFRAEVIVQPATRLPACSHVDVNGTSQVSRRSILCLCLGPGPRPNQRSLAYL